MSSDDPLSPSEEDLKEIFALFTSPAGEEIRQIYDETSGFTLGRKISPRNTH
jgi:hypothetical protein